MLLEGGEIDIKDFVKMIDSNIVVDDVLGNIVYIYFGILEYLIY